MIFQNFDTWLARISTHVNLSIWFFPLPTKQSNPRVTYSIFSFFIFFSVLKNLEKQPNSHLLTFLFFLSSFFPLKLIKLVERRVTHHLKIQFFFFFFFFFNYINFHHLFHTNMSYHINIIQLHKLSFGYLGYKVQRRCIHF